MRKIMLYSNRGNSWKYLETRDALSTNHVATSVSDSCNGKRREPASDVSNVDRLWPRCRHGDQGPFNLLDETPKNQHFDTCVKLAVKIKIKTICWNEENSCSYSRVRRRLLRL